MNLIFGMKVIYLMRLDSLVKIVVERCTRNTTKVPTVWNINYQIIKNNNTTTQKKASGCFSPMLFLYPKIVAEHEHVLQRIGYHGTPLSSSFGYNFFGHALSVSFERSVCSGEANSLLHLSVPSVCSQLSFCIAQPAEDRLFFFRLRVDHSNTFLAQ